ncbi:MAG: low molecular weight phosphatase family protein [Flavobacteriaceae bacterium]|nr:low molecular weight phosphatase family protein [Flavobacteriaceae bacterium]|tara:strand:+ start:70 stop:498 length:429 start_codon:yes stop_codon:yes gene_type:complete
MNILFLCVGNSARSQIAEGLAKSMMGSEHNIQSAGSQPSGSVHQNAISTMKEIGIDISSYESKSIDDLDKEFIDYVDFTITLCSEEFCPTLNNKAKKIHWANQDPDNDSYSDHQLEREFRRTRENIFNLLKKFFIENSSFSK